MAKKKLSALDRFYKRVKELRDLDKEIIRTRSKMIILEYRRKIKIEAMESLREEIVGHGA